MSETSHTFVFGDGALSEHLRAEATVTHQSGKAVDVPDRHIQINGTTVVVETDEWVNDLYGDGERSVTVKVQGGE
ncbi:MAG: hypothetical protein ACI8XM_002001 [Haloarculaceae archaeon]|jgi:hypothetical protein